MGFKRVFSNILLAAILALPLAAQETRLGFKHTEPQPPPKKAVKAIPPPSLLSTEDYSFIIELASRKAARILAPTSPVNQFDAMIKQVADKHKVSPALVKALIQAESNFNPHAVSPFGAIGLMQVLPETARTVGVNDPLDPKSNIIAGVRYLKSLLDMFEDDETMALAAYNSGPASVLKFGGIPPYPQTRIFVNRVMFYYHSYLES
ncbi:MAG: lytic transglycosylase domain-containing protein [Thermodesulfobacteriota bacterium]